MMNIKNHEIYSSKFVLYVLDLTMIEDSSLRKEYGELYDWAALFKATDWRDLKMLAAKNPYIEDTIFTLHEMTEDEKIREIIAKICETAKAFAPEYNVQKIYDTLDTINE